MHPETAAELERALEHAGQAHPAIPVSEAFRAFVAEAMHADPSGGAPKIPTHLGDMLVAHGAVHGHPRAIAQVEAALKELPPMLGRFRLSEAEEREVLQELRLRVLVGSEAETMAGVTPIPRLLEYRGSGPLGAWLRASAVRLVLSRFRKSERLREDELSEVAGGVNDGDDVELAHAKRRYQEPFQKAFRAAMEELSPRDKTVLRMHLLDGRSIDEIGLVFRVHRATIARWISDARSGVGKRTQALLTQNLHADSAEFRSITRLCYSQLDVSLHSLFAAQSGT